MVGKPNTWRATQIRGGLDSQHATPSPKLASKAGFQSWPAGWPGHHVIVRLCPNPVGAYPNSGVNQNMPYRRCDHLSAGQPSKTTMPFCAPCPPARAAFLFLKAGQATTYLAYPPCFCVLHYAFGCPTMYDAVHVESE